MSSILENTNPQEMPRVAELSLAAPLSRRDLRKAIDRIFPIASELDAFLIDFFPHVFRLFSVGMDRTARVNLLFQRVTESEITLRLRQEFPTEVAQAEIASTVQSSLGFTPQRIRYTVVLVAHLHEVDDAKLRAIVDQIRNHTCDSELTIEEIRSGSVILVCEGSQDGFSRLYEDFSIGRLRELQGLPLFDIVLQVGGTDVHLGATRPPSDAAFQYQRWATLRPGGGGPVALAPRASRGTDPVAPGSLPGGFGVRMQSRRGADTADEGAGSTLREVPALSTARMASASGAQTDEPPATRKPHHPHAVMGLRIARWLTASLVLCSIVAILHVTRPQSGLPEPGHAGIEQGTEAPMTTEPADLLPDEIQPEPSLPSAPAPQAAVGQKAAREALVAAREEPAPSRRVAQPKMAVLASPAPRPTRSREEGAASPIQVFGVDGAAKKAVQACARRHIAPLQLPAGTEIVLERVGSRWFLWSGRSDHEKGLARCLELTLAKGGSESIPHSLRIRVGQRRSEKARNEPELR